MSDARVVIVGSGVAGALVAEALVARGIGPVVMLEAGPRVPMREQRRWLDYLTTGVRPYDDCRDSPADPCASPAAFGFLHESRLFVRGGSTLHWGGWCLRLRPEDFARRTATGIGADWPLDYAALETWYLQAEHALGVAGDSVDAAQARSGPYPYAALPYTIADAEIIRGFDALGVGYAPLPIARNVEPREGLPACQTIGTCKYCPLGARYTGDQPLDRLEARGGARFELRTGAAVTRVVMAAPGRAAGVEYVETGTGRRVRLDADAVIVCAGALETPKLLLASGSPGNAGGHLGRNLSWHPLLYARGTRRRNPGRIRHELDFPTLCSRHYDTPSEQAAGKLFLYFPPVDPSPDVAAAMRAGATPADLDRLVTGPWTVELQGLMELPADGNSRVANGRGTTRLGLPATDVRYSPATSAGEQLARNLARMGDVLAAAGFSDVETGVYPARGDHAAGTCRMSANAADGVVDADLRVHGVENLWVCSNAVFPSAGAVNPTLTLAALAMRLGASLTVP